LAAGLGLAALMSHLGMGEGFANILMLALLAGAAFFLVRFLLRRFAGGHAPQTPTLAGAGASAGGANSAAGTSPWSATPLRGTQDADSGLTPRSSLDPAGPVLAPTSSSAAPLADAGITRAFVPAAFDADGFARTAKMIFIRLQTAHDTADLDDLKRFTTPELYASLRLDIQERGSVPQHTDVVKVEAEVLDVANEAERQVVSVRFHGQVVEERGAAPTDFNEVWHLVKPHDDSRSWAIAGIEQMA
jgi:predicted lipid-binding transport protein (Tim44 family)